MLHTAAEPEAERVLYVVYPAVFCVCCCLKTTEITLIHTVGCVRSARQALVVTDPQHDGRAQLDPRGRQAREQLARHDDPAQQVAHDRRGSHATRRDGGGRWKGEQNKPNQTKPKQNKTNQNKTKQNKTKQSKKQKQNKTKPNKNKDTK